MAATVSSVVYNATDFFPWVCWMERQILAIFTTAIYMLFICLYRNSTENYSTVISVESRLFYQTSASFILWNFLDLSHVGVLWNLSVYLQLNWTFIWLHLVGIVWIFRKVVDFFKVSGSLFVLFPPYLPSHWNFFHLIKPPNFYSYIISNGLSLSQYISSNSKVSLVSVVFWRWMRATIKKGSGIKYKTAKRQFWCSFWWSRPKSDRKQHQQQAERKKRNKFPKCLGLYSSTIYCTTIPHKESAFLRSLCFGIFLWIVERVI